MAEMTLTFTGVRCEICNFVWLLSWARNERPNKVTCPNCNQVVEVDMVSLDDFQSKDEP